MNIMLLSVGTRNKIVRYFKSSLAGIGKVIATDMSRLAPALYDADRHYIVPSMNDKEYLDTIFAICDKEKIRGILSLIDPELSVLAKNMDTFRRQGVMVIGSSLELCELSLNKYQMYQWLKEHGYKYAKSYMIPDDFYNAVNKGEVYYPVIVKPSRGSASVLVSKADDHKTVEMLLQQHDGLMIQEYMKGQEIGADVYIDMLSHEVVSIFTKRKIKMRAGETDKAVSFKDERLFKFLTKFVKEVGFIGQIDIDLFQIGEDYYISEVNPRFGGGYPHAYESGMNHMKLIVNNLKGIKNEIQIGKYQEGIFMMKYNDIYTFSDPVLMQDVRT